MSGATAVRDVVVPGWLAEVVRPRRVPWPEMIRAALAICVPLSASYAAGGEGWACGPAVVGWTWWVGRGRAGRIRTGDLRDPNAAR
jgi:hypothetical protein